MAVGMTENLPDLGVQRQPQLVADGPGDAALHRTWAEGHRDAVDALGLRRTAAGQCHGRGGQ